MYSVTIRRPSAAAPASARTDFAPKSRWPITSGCPGNAAACFKNATPSPVSPRAMMASTEAALTLSSCGPEVTIVRLPCVSDQRRDPIPLLQHLDEQVGPRVVDANTAAEHRNLPEVEGLCDVVGEQVSQELIARRDAENPLSALGRARAGASDDVRDPGLLDRFAACHDEGAKQLPHDGHHLRLGDQRTACCDGALC